MANNRQTYLDLASGIMTIWVMIFHALCPMWGTMELAHFPWLYFFMPWFFYKSGMMFRPKEAHVEWKNGCRKLLTVFAIWSVIGYIAHIGWHLFAGDLTWRMAVYSPLRSLFLTCEVPINGALWFLPILFLVRMTGNWLLNKHVSSWLIAAVSLIITIALKFIGFRLMPTWISGTLWGLFFFAMGCALRNYEENPYVIVLSMFVYVLSLFTSIPSVYCGGQKIWNQILWFPACACACVIFNNVCRWVTYFVENIVIGGQMAPFAIITRW